MRYVTIPRALALAAWSDGEIKRAITTGVGRDGGRLAPPRRARRDVTTRQ